MSVRTLAPKGVHLGTVPHRLEEEKSVSDDTGPPECGNLLLGDAF